MHSEDAFDHSAIQLLHGQFIADIREVGEDLHNVDFYYLFYGGGEIIVSQDPDEDVSGLVDDKNNANACQAVDEAIAYINSVRQTNSLLF